MTDFMIRFLICNVFLCGIIGMLLAAKRIFKNHLSGRMQYNLWFLLLGLLTVPFFPFRFPGFPQMISRIGKLRYFPSSGTGTEIAEAAAHNLTAHTDWMNDFTLSVHSASSSMIGSILLGIWILGMLAMILLIFKSALRLHRLEKSALPLQNAEVRKLYHHCLEELEIHRDIPVYSTAFLKSPMFVGLFRPCIFLPIHLISDYNESDLRYMLLHELQHYKHHDSVSCYLMNLAGIVYWFHPLVWYALKEMRNDREVACDTSVLQMLEEDDYVNYGNTLINFAEKISLTPFPFAAGLGGNRKQIKRRILNIVSYEKPTVLKKMKGIAAFVLTAVLLLGFTPLISTCAAAETHYHWNSSSQKVSIADLSAYFGTYEGSFVLYDLENDAWTIHNMERATLRVAPDSTYKIYDALFGLEAGIISPEDSFLTWDGKIYPFDAWNSDQTLESAMDASVNWYFQTIDQQLGASEISDYIQNIDYGNENISGNLSAYWLESSLKISPIEQVELLTKLQKYSLSFAPENINAVKEAICLSSSDAGSFYGKTGTGRVDGQDVNGWFVGFAETADHTYFFAANIGADHGATGSNAAEITMSILSDMNIWN